MRVLYVKYKAPIDIDPKMFQELSFSGDLGRVSTSKVMVLGKRGFLSEKGTGGGVYGM